MSLPGFYFSASPTARVRVRINDGFNETASVSAPFRALDAPPQVTILSPTGGAASVAGAVPQQAAPQVAGDARVELEGQALDQRLRMLTGASLRWFDGRVPLGTGSALSAGPLPPGVNHIRLVARDAFGKTASDSITVVVTRVDLPFLRLALPSSVSSTAGTITLRALSQVAVTLTVANQRFVLAAGVGRGVQVSVLPGSAPLLLPMAVAFDQNTIPCAARVIRQ